MRIVDLGRQYLATLEALREMEMLLSPAVTPGTRPQTAAWIQSIAEKLPAEKRAAFFEALKAFGETLSGAVNAADAVNAEAGGKEEEDAGLTIQASTDGVPSGSQRFSLQVDDPEVAEALGQAILEGAYSVKRTPPQQLLLRGLLTMGVAAFDVLVGQLMTEHFRLHPGAAGTDRAEFSLDDLEELGSIDEAREVLIARRVEAQHQGGLDKWVDWFRGEPLKIDLRRLAIDWDSTYELFQRRHIIVHNGARVSRLYLTRTNRAAPSAGTEIVLDTDYVVHALDQLAALGVGLTVATSLMLVPGELGAPGQLLEEGVRRLSRDRRWEAVLALCGVAEKPQWPERRRLFFKTEGWLARKELHGLESIRDELEHFDVSALRDDIAVKRLILLDRHEEALEALSALLESSEVTQRELLSEPLYQSVLIHPDFASLGISVGPPDDAEPVDVDRDDDS
jgi:hypothetical protein